MALNLNSVIYSNALNFNDMKKSIVKNFITYTCKKLNLKKVPTIELVAERIQSMTTGAYDPEKDKIYILAQNRLMADVLRTLAHELVHAMQRETGKFNVGDEVQDAGGSIEDEANAKAGELLKLFVKDMNMDVIYSV